MSIIPEELIEQMEFNLSAEGQKMRRQILTEKFALALASNPGMVREDNRYIAGPHLVSVALMLADAVIEQEARL